MQLERSLTRFGDNVGNAFATKTTNKNKRKQGLRNRQQEQRKTSLSTTKRIFGSWRDHSTRQASLRKFSMGAGMGLGGG